MNNQIITAILAITSFSFSVGAMAQSMSRNEYKAAEKNIVIEYKSAKASCGSFADNVRDICLVEAKGKEKVAKAELEARYKPSRKANFKVSATRANADYELAKEKCDGKAGNDKAVCLKEAKAARVGTKSVAKAQLKTSRANAAANEESTEAHIKAKGKGREAHQEAASDRVNANYAVEKEKCNAMVGDAKGRCIDDAKMQYGK